jgi:putative hydrolase of the HAD superfamily
VLRAVLFDLDDTLVDQRTAADAAVTAWAAEHGVTDEGAARRWEALSEIHYARWQRREISFTEQRRSRVREFLGLRCADDEADAVFAAYLTRYEAGWAAFDDAVPALRRTRAAGLVIGILTNGDRDQSRSKLRRCGLTSHIDLLVASSTLPAGKPDRRAFLAAVHRVGVRPAETLMVGNSLEKDVRGALAAGLAAVLVDRHDDHPRAACRRIRTLDDLEMTGW